MMISDTDVRIMAMIMNASDDDKDILMLNWHDFAIATTTYSLERQH